MKDLVDEVRGSGPSAVRAAARLMSLVTDRPQRLAELLAGCRDWPQPRMVLGVTGAPGSGKSTLVDRLALEYRRRFPDRRLGIVAVDPSSPFTGGAVLGDRVRMMRHATDPMVFIRSLASRGRLGGLALGAKGVVRVLGLAGCDVVIAETVGVGQSEVEIAQNADLVVVVLAPGQGDGVQMLKAGLLEAGDLFVVNKADRPEAAAMHHELLAMLIRNRSVQDGLADEASDAAHEEPHSDSPSPVAGRWDAHHGGLTAPGETTDVHAGVEGVFLTSAAHNQGIEELVDELERRAAASSAQWQEIRRNHAEREIREAVVEEVRRLAAGYVADEAFASQLEGFHAGQASLADLAAYVWRRGADSLTNKP
jgi:LAO/AO transport system ATPase